MNPPSTAAPKTSNGESALHDLFALSDEQILEMDPEVTPVGQPLAAVQEQPPPAPPEKCQADASEDASSARISDQIGKSAQAGVAAPPELPKWLADRMADPQAGGEAREFWNGIVQARQDAAAYREVFAKPEDARVAAERSRQLEQIDRLYFGAEGKSAQEMAATREQLAQTLLREDPAAFREMVFAGLRALEQANVEPPSRAASAGPAQPQEAGLPTASGRVPPGATQAPSPEAAQIAAYRAFEKAANEELEREVGGAIVRVLEQALPTATRPENAPVRERLATSVRQEIETALRGDPQLGQQVAQILSARRFDDASRAQVVRLIAGRAHQLVPGAARRVLGEWTQTAVASHRARAQRSEAASARREVETASSVPESARSRARTAREVDYRKLSDEQILDM